MNYDIYKSKLEILKKDVEHRVLLLANNNSKDEVRDGLGSVEKNLLDQVDKALLLLKNGDYGSCNNCGEQIQAQRLDAVPYAFLCINCSD